MSGSRIALVLHPKITPGEAANVSAILAAGLKADSLLEPVGDKSGNLHVGITSSLAVLKAKTAGQLLSLAEHLRRNGAEVSHVCFSRAGQQLNDQWDTYRQELRSSETVELELVGVALCGPRDRVLGLTRKYSLYR